MKPSRFTSPSGDNREGFPSSPLLGPGNRPLSNSVRIDSVLPHGGNLFVGIVISLGTGSIGASFQSTVGMNTGGTYGAGRSLNIFVL